MTERGHTNIDTHILTQKHMKLKYRHALIYIITENNNSYVIIIESILMLFHFFFLIYNQEITKVFSIIAFHSSYVYHTVYKKEVFEEVILQ